MRLTFRQTHLYRFVNMELLTRFELVTSSLPSDKMPSSRCGTALQLLRHGVGFFDLLCAALVAVILISVSSPIRPETV